MTQFFSGSVSGPKGGGSFCPAQSDHATDGPEPNACDACCEPQNLIHQTRASEKGRVAMQLNWLESLPGSAPD